jgi:hypothetical protein
MTESSNPHVCTDAVIAMHCQATGCVGEGRRCTSPDLDVDDTPIA